MNGSHKRQSKSNTMMKMSMMPTLIKVVISAEKLIVRPWSILYDTPQLLLLLLSMGNTERTASIAISIAQRFTARESRTG
jgi:hypothetical protein